MIQLSDPLALLALLAIPILVALHLLQPRRRRVVLSTLALWQAALQDREGAHGLRRLLRNLSLLLLLAAALALGVGVAGPQWLMRTAEPGDVVLVLDVSASMKTRAGIGTTRFDQALAEAGARIDALPRAARMLVMTSGRKPVLRSGFESDRAALRRVLAGLRAGDEAGRPDEALTLALTLLRGRDDARIVFLTDGAFDPALDPGSPQVTIRTVGGPARNIAITRFDLRQEPADKARFQVLMTVRNYTDAAVVVPASASLNGRELFKRDLALGARAERTLVLPFSGRALGQAVARIDVDDDLTADNAAFAALDTLQPLRVLLFSRGNFYLESVLEALPEVALQRREWRADADLARLAREHDVVVFDGVPAPSLPPGNFLLVDTVAPGLPFSEAGRVARPGIVGTGTSALMRHVDLTAVRIGEARRVVVPAAVPGLQRLFWSGQTDLALALLDEGRRIVYLGFDLGRSNFPLQAAFPLFVSQSLEWLHPRGLGFVSTHTPAGEAHVLHLPASEHEVQVRTPSGEVAKVAVKDGAARFEATAEAGIYRYGAENAQRFFAVSLADAGESNVDRRYVARDRSEARTAAGPRAESLLPLWPYLLALALVLLGLEWWVWSGSRARA